MTIKFTGRKKPFDCAVKDDLVCTAQRARWSDGHWADVCTGHMEIFRKNVARFRTARNPMWFLRGRSQAQETKRP